MKKRICITIGLCCYLAGIIGAAYYGIWKMLCIPVHMLVVSLMSGELTFTLVLVCAVKILFSTTLTGLIWCMGYIAYNYFRGNEDPDWESLMEERMKKHTRNNGKEEGQIS